MTTFYDLRATAMRESFFGSQRLRLRNSAVGVCILELVDMFLLRLARRFCSRLQTHLTAFRLNVDQVQNYWIQRFKCRKRIHSASTLDRYNCAWRQENPILLRKTSLETAQRQSCINHWRPLFLALFHALVCCRQEMILVK